MSKQQKSALMQFITKYEKALSKSNNFNHTLIKLVNKHKNLVYFNQYGINTTDAIYFIKIYFDEC